MYNYVYPTHKFVIMIFIFLFSHMESVSVVFICDTELWDEFECKVTSSSFHLRKKGS